MESFPFEKNTKKGIAIVANLFLLIQMKRLELLMYKEKKMFIDNN